MATRGPQNCRWGLERCLPLDFGRSKQLLQNKFSNRGGEKTGKNRGGNGKKRYKNDENSGHYVIASSQPPEGRPLECRMLELKILIWEAGCLCFDIFRIAYRWYANPKAWFDCPNYKSLLIFIPPGLTQRFNCSNYKSLLMFLCPIW